MTKQYLFGALVALAASVIIFLVVQILYIRFNGSAVAVPTIPRGPETTGSGPQLSYAIMGDSTAISQGSEYEDGFAVASIAHIGKTHTVTTINTAISGATTEEIVRDQLKTATSFKPDIVLLAAGANDSTHFTKGEVTKRSVQQIIDELKKVNPEVKIIVTGSPAMDSVTRFPLGAKQLLGYRSQQVNKIFDTLIKDNNLIHAPIALKTRDAFIADPTLTAADHFHPNARGYALWIPVINEAVDVALTR